MVFLLVFVMVCLFLKQLEYANLVQRILHQSTMYAPATTVIFKSLQAALDSLLSVISME